MIDFGQFLAVDMRVGQVIAVEDFPEARKPAWKLMTHLARKMDLTLDLPSALATFTEAAARCLADKVQDPAAAFGPELPARVISGSPIHEAPEEPFEAIVGHQPPAAQPVPVYAGFHK